MTYQTIVIDNAPKAKKMAAAIEEKANKMARAGWELATFSVTNSAKAILVFQKSGDARQEAVVQEQSESEALLQEEIAEAVGDAE